MLQELLCLNLPLRLWRQRLLDRCWFLQLICTPFAQRRDISANAVGHPVENTAVGGHGSRDAHYRAGWYQMYEGGFPAENIRAMRPYGGTIDRDSGAAPPPHRMPAHVAQSQQGHAHSSL